MLLDNATWIICFASKEKTEGQEQGVWKAFLRLLQKCLSYLLITKRLPTA